MPFIRFRGFTGHQLEETVPRITEQMALICNIPRERLKAERYDVQALTPSPASIEILMFQRDQEIHNRIASSIHGILADEGLSDAHIFFNILSPTLYYKQGKPLTDYPLE
ncbi:DUF1904 family protein [Paenibacillus illinoisensis]|uniref:DUF1904 family protein n=1 Tax=Paenibacillus illinoisensis TaxID=59845 RepID=UPI001C8D2FB4|nr:DUF1904 family protein [Paenibacillus illinoisensis]MBY0216550.1 DUF1904 family protein [Paenibacillus illinoisensis]